MTATDAVFLPVRELGAQIRAGTLSPVALTEHFLERLQRLGPRYNAVVTVTAERARREAQRAERELAAGHDRGPLHGIPYGAKDLLATADGIPTTWGAAPLRDQQLGYDAAVVERLQRAGAVLVAKLAMVELAGGMGYRQPHAAFTGPGLNPWDPSRWSGGSSSGSGSAVAAGLVPFAIGSETRGSILTPAAFCGVTGLRPTYGRVSRFGAMTLCWSLDKLGPMALSADDCGLVLAAIAGADPRDETCATDPWRYDATGPHGSATRRFRLAVLRDATDGADDAVAAAFDSACGVLAETAELEEVQLPEHPYDEVVDIILQAEAASALDDFVAAGHNWQLTAVEDRYGGFARQTILAADYLRAQRLRRKFARTLHEQLARYDALLAPSMAVVAPPADADLADLRHPQLGMLSAAGNGAGLPALSLPCGHDSQGLPIGLQLLGSAASERTLLDVANTFQQRTDWHLRHPRSALA